MGDMLSNEKNQTGPVKKEKSVFTLYFAKKLTLCYILPTAEGLGKRKQYHASLTGEPWDHSEHPLIDIYIFGKNKQNWYKIKRMKNPVRIKLISKWSARSCFHSHRDEVSSKLILKNLDLVQVWCTK